MGLQLSVLDSQPERAVQRWGPEPRVLHIDRLDEIVEEKGIELGVIAVPGPSAQEAADRLVRAGIKAILNFAPAHITVPQGTSIYNVDFTVYLENLAYRIKSALSESTSSGDRRM